MRLPIVLLLPALLTACDFMPLTPATLEREVEQAAEYINADAHEALASEIGNAKVSAVAEGGDTLVIKLENLPLGNQQMNPTYMRKFMRSSVCDDPSSRRVVEAGGKFRIEMISNTGKASQPVTIAHCG